MLEEEERSESQEEEEEGDGAPPPTSARWLGALEVQALGACRADERFASMPLLLRIFGPAASQDRLLAHLTQVGTSHHPPSIPYSIIPFFILHSLTSHEPTTSSSTLQKSRSSSDASVPLSSPFESATSIGLAPFSAPFLLGILSFILFYFFPSPHLTSSLYTLHLFHYSSPLYYPHHDKSIICLYIWPLLLQRYLTLCRSVMFLFHLSSYNLMHICIQLYTSIHPH